ncbi:MAG: hypothetical protein AB7D02_01015, partial [Candidatus Paceibacterota bacterium]
MEKQEIIFVKEFLEKLLTLANFQLANLEIKEIPENIIHINVSVEEDKITSGLLIGKNGSHLEAFNYLLNLIFQKKFPESKKRIIFDVNN